MRLNDNDIAKVRNSADIVDVVSHYIQVQKSGRNYKAICPFHDDNTPSLNISTSKQIYKCFSCGAGGNVFSFVQNYEKIGFVESVIKVAEIAGINIDVNMDEYKKPIDTKKQALYNVLNETIKFTMYQLKSSKATLIKKYLTDRGINDELIEMFNIGYNGEEEELYKFLSAKGHKDSDMVSCNVIRINELGVQDVFSKRITFPIHDTLGNPIGFTARSIDDNVSKYINTSMTELFNKGNIVYNYHRAKKHAKQSGSLIIVEGVTDVIALAKANVYNVVATLGTACTAQQILAMKKAANKLVFCYDGDSAGQNATFKAAKLAIESNADVRIIKNSSLLDPDEIIKTSGIDALTSMLKNEMTWLEFCFNYYLKKYNLELYSEKKEFVEKMMNEINQSKDEFDKQNFLHQLSQLTGFRLNQLPVKNEPKKKIDKNSFVYKKALEGRISAERLILSNMLNSSDAIQVFINKLGFLIDDDCQIIAMLIIDEQRKGNEIKVANILDLLSSEKQKSLMIEISSNEIYREQYNEDSFISYINRIKKWIIEDKNESLKKQILEETNPNKLDKLVVEYNDNLIELRRYNVEEDR